MSEYQGLFMSHTDPWQESVPDRPTPVSVRLSKEPFQRPYLCPVAGPFHTGLAGPGHGWLALSPER